MLEDSIDFPASTDAPNSAPRRRTSRPVKTGPADGAAESPAETPTKRAPARRRAVASAAVADHSADQAVPTAGRTPDQPAATTAHSPDQPAPTATRTRTARTRRVVADDQPVQPSPAPAEAAEAPSSQTSRTGAARSGRTRAARPAGPDHAGDVPPAKSAEATSTRAPQPAATDHAGGVPPASVPETASTRTPRRRSTTAAHQDQPTSNDRSGGMTAPTDQASGTTAADQPAEPATASDRPVARRTRSSRTTSAARAPEATAEPTGGATSSTQPVNPAGAAAPGDQAEADPIGQALTALGRQTRSRRRAAAADAPEILDTIVSAMTGDEAETGPAGADDHEPGDGPRRRRRRRGGRNRHHATSDLHDDQVDEPTEASDEPADDTTADDATSPDDTTATHRRRRRRRRGEEVDDIGDEDTDVVVKVREPRKPLAKPASDVTGIDGSTRLEAKKQRRREGRAASRRRAPILSEAEFLARREAVERQMLIRQKEDYSQIAVIEDGILVEHYVDRASATSLIGNIYLGKVQNVLPGMEAAFVDIGRVRNAVLYAGEVDWDSFGDKGQNRKIEDVFSPGQMVLVQVSKDPVGAKGARLTSHISIPGRYVVYAPQGHVSGVSRKLSDLERSRLKGILDELVDQGASVVIRTAAESAGEDELIRDVNRLKAQWEVISKKASGKQTPQLLYAEPDLTMRIVRDLFTEDFAKLVVDGNGGMDDACDTVEAYVQHIAPHLADRIQKWNRDEQVDLFAQYRVDEQIAKALDRRVHLPSGGSLVIDRTEAMTVIDVNTGKFTGSGGNLESTVTANNLEAAEEIVRQLRLRDIGGIIIVDFIDMVLASNRELLLRRLVECLSRDRTRHQVSEITSLGLVQLTRKKVGTGLAEAFTKTCELCNGEGHIRYDEPIDSQVPADGGERHTRGARRHS